MIERDLADHRVQHVLDLRRQHDAPALRIGRIEQRAEGQHLAEHARRLGQRQRRARHQVALLRRQHLMHAVAQLVRQRHHVARAAVVVQQQIGMRRRHRRMRERAARLARLQRRIDPRPVEEAPADLGEFRTERAIRRQHALARLVPGDRPVIVVRQRRIAVPVLQLRQPEPLRLHQVVAMREPREIRAHRRHQRIDDLVLDHVGAVAVAARARIVPPRVDDLLVLRQRVGDQREQPDILAERLADRTPRGLAHRTVAIRQLVQRGADGQFLAAQRHPHRRDRLIEQPAPRAAPGHLLLVQQLLQFVGQLVRPEHAQVAQPGPPLRQRRIRQLLLQHRVIQPVQLQA